MSWNWQKPGWPGFVYDAAGLASAEERFLLNAGTFIGAYWHLGLDERDFLGARCSGEGAT